MCIACYACVHAKLVLLLSIGLGLLLLIAGTFSSLCSASPKHFDYNHERQTWEQSSGSLRNRLWLTQTTLLIWAIKGPKNCNGGVLASPPETSCKESSCNHPFPCDIWAMSVWWLLLVSMLTNGILLNPGASLLIGLKDHCGCYWHVQQFVIIDTCGSCHVNSKIVWVTAEHVEQLVWRIWVLVN